jgi:glycerophosphoryl diester phosphodiesterase
MEVTINTKLIAHRGNTKSHPENTLSAFKAALESGADAIELDAHLTSDGELIVHHDYYLGSPDNGEGKIYEKDLAYIQSLKIGDSEKIPTLEEVFELIGNKLQYEIELKGFTEEFLTKVIALVKKHDLANVIEFTSPNAYNLTRIKALEPSFKTGTFVAALPGWMDEQLGQTLAINNALLGNINVLHCPFTLINEEFIVVAHSKGLLVHAADCDIEDDLRVAFSVGVDQLSTNELNLAISLRTQN